MRRFVTTAVVLVVLLAVGAVVADRVLHARAEDRVAEQIDGYLDVSGERTVTIEGFPFLTQLATGELDSVRASAGAVVVEGVELVDVRAHARAVAVEQPITVGDLEVVATLPDAALQSLVDRRVPRADVTVGSTADGVELGTEVLGADLAILAEPAVENGTLTISVSSISLGGAEIDADSLTGIVDEDLLSLDLDVRLPLGLDLVAAAPEDGSVRLTFSGQDVVLDQ
ncbi:LmeA family phospholipid-binding protein [Georgenia subflava]|uniref:DUF2993 domain-containing protein n=1 Tax=Georgenia subflava TaxID=1622177 RepID=A0A6N7ELB4_9MICO|nr:DUF2993 domain-containing protein [Georgenia subflava]MPV39182.1 DUF2993 domain-containing protein [Georgenia subflava]